MRKSQGQGVTQKPWLVSLLLLLSAGLWLESITATYAAEKEGKFHLIFLVSAVNLTPGSKVFVDPVFFTDGKEVKNFHDYCKKKGQFLNLNQIVDDLAVINDYCTKKTFRFSPVGYHTLNNHGQRIALDPIEFKVIDTIEQAKEPVMMGSSQVSSYTPGTIDPPKWLREDGAPEYFFLMSINQAVLRKIAPISKTNASDLKSLLQRAVEFSGTAKGKSEGAEYQLLKKEFSAVSDTKLVNPIYTDIDSDGKLDLILGLEAKYKSIIEKAAPDIRWLGIAYILGNGRSVLGYWPEMFPTDRYDRLSESVDAYARFLSNGYPIMTPLIMVRLGKCGYVLRYMENRSMRVAHGIHFEHKPVTGQHESSCADFRIQKLALPLP